MASDICDIINAWGFKNLREVLEKCKLQVIVSHTSLVFLTFPSVLVSQRCNRNIKLQMSFTCIL